MDKEALFEAVLNAEADWREQVNEAWECLNNDDKDLIEILALEAP